MLGTNRNMFSVSVMFSWTFVSVPINSWSRLSAIKVTELSGILSGISVDFSFRRLSYIRRWEKLTERCKSSILDDAPSLPYWPLLRLPWTSRVGRTTVYDAECRWISDVRRRNKVEAIVLLSNDRRSATDQRTVERPLAYILLYGSTYSMDLYCISYVLCNIYIRHELYSVKLEYMGVYV